MPATTNPVFGRILIASVIEDQVIATLQKWLPTYLSEIERQLNLPTNSLPHPRDYTNRNSLDTEASTKIPRVVAVSPGTTGAPLKQGDGSYRATWQIGVGVVTGAKDEDRANVHIKAYGGAVRAILLQNPALAGLPGIMGISWMDESYDDLDVSNQNQLLKVVAQMFHVEVQDVVNARYGPDVPSIAAPAPYPTVDRVIINVEKVNVNAEV